MNDDWNLSHFFKLEKNTCMEIFKYFKTAGKNKHLVKCIKNVAHLEFLLAIQILHFMSIFT